MPNFFATVCSVKLSSGFVHWFWKQKQLHHTCPVFNVDATCTPNFTQINICTVKKNYQKITLIAQIVITFSWCRWETINGL